MKLKKLTALLIVSVMSAVSICPAFASDTENISSILIETEDCSDAKNDFMSDIISITNLIKINLGRDNIDYTNAKIGEPFLINNTNIYIFPVLVNGKIERIIQMTMGDESHYAINEFFSDNLNDLSTSTYSVIADEYFDVFAVNNDETVILEENPDSEGNITVPAMPLSITDTETVDIKDVFIDLSTVPMPATDANGNGRWLDVPQIKQDDNTCWAGAMASILNYYGENLTVSKIKSDTGKSGAANTSEVKSYFSNYGYSSTMFNQYSLSFSNIKTEINAGRPIYQAIGYANSTGGGHAVVIEGYQEKGSGTFDAVSIMDPYYPQMTDCDYKTNYFEYAGRVSREGLKNIK